MFILLFLTTIHAINKPLYLPGFFQKYNLPPFSSAFIIPPDSEHPHHSAASVLVGQSRSPSGEVINTAVDLATGRILPDYSFPTQTVASHNAPRYSIENTGISSLDDQRPWRVAFGRAEEVEQVVAGSILTSFAAKTSPEGEAAWKFLEPNSVCVLTRSPEGSALRILRTETGAVMGSFFFENLGQAKMAYRDNTVLVHGWNRKLLRHEIYVAELFLEGEIAVGELIFGRAKKSQVLKAEFKKFIFPHGEIRFMEITKTRKFLAPPTVIFALADGRVARKLLPVLTEQGSGVIDFEGVEILTQQEFLDDVELIVTGPTILESTSAVVVIGNFGLHISSVASPLLFDSLGDGFDREMLATSLSVVAALFVLSEVLARRATKLRKWK